MVGLVVPLGLFLIGQTRLVHLGWRICRDGLGGRECGIELLFVGRARRGGGLGLRSCVLGGQRVSL